MIYDCFIFNDELDLLELRLEFLGGRVDHFILVESARTLSGKPKPLHFKNNAHRFSKWKDQIIHLVAPDNNMPAWEYEFFQRNYIREGLKNAAKEDIVFISDADEILNIPSILSLQPLQLPAVIELSARYYFMNLQTSDRFWVNIVANADFIIHNDIGLRYQNYETLCPNRISTADILTGWHFSYLFGYDASLYKEKIGSFSHQEYNTAYWLSENRIKACVKYNIDLFERAHVRICEETAGLEPLLPFIKGKTDRKVAQQT
ncbi:MAG: hypothetical protein IPP73_02305 [Chitinophagaceae bacterium]|nr:hypothetical protein [Chitinophagaceae bacterium]